MSLARIYPWPWIALLILIVVAETVPLALGKPQYTLSDYIWRLEGPGWSFFRYVIAAFSVWFGGHMIWRWWR